MTSRPAQGGLLDSTASGGVPFYTGARSFSRLWPEIREQVEEVIARGKYSHGAKVLELERAIAAYTGARFAVGVNSGTDALVLLLRACGIGKGDEVLVPTFTFFASASAIVHCGATPVFVDIDPITYALDVDRAEAAVTARTRAIMPVHLFAQMADMTKVKELAVERDLLIIEDSAEAIGMWYGSTHAGLIGSGGVLSFFPTKTLGALGDAGMILTNDADVADQAGSLRHHGRMGKTIDHIAGISNLSGVSGTNSKMDDIQAGILIAKLGRLDEDIAARGGLARQYDEILKGVSGIRSTPTIVPRDEPTNPVYYVYLIEADDRDGLVEFLSERGIGTEVYYPRPLHLQPCFEALGYSAGDFPAAESACRHAVAIPLYPDMSSDDVATVGTAIRRFYGAE